MDTGNVAATAGAGGSGVAGGGVTAQFQTSQNGDAFHTQVKVAADFAEGTQRERDLEQATPHCCLNFLPMLEGRFCYSLQSRGGDGVQRGRQVAQGHTAAEGKIQDSNLKFQPMSTWQNPALNHCLSLHPCCVALAVFLCLSELQSPHPDPASAGDTSFVTKKLSVWDL